MTTSIVRAALASALASALIAGACAGPPARAADTTGAADTTPGRTRMTADSLADSLRVVLTIPGEVPLGDSVPLALEVRNVGRAPLTLYLRGREPVFDAVVMRASGDTVWHRLADQVIPAIVQTRTLAAGEALTLRDTWTQRTTRGEPVGAGSYVVRATVLTDAPDGLPAPPASLRIVRR